MGKYLPGYSYGMSGGPLSISERRFRSLGFNFRGPEEVDPKIVTANCINCKEPTEIDGKPAVNYYYRCTCKQCESCGKVNSYKCFACERATNAR